MPQAAATADFPEKTRTTRVQVAASVTIPVAAPAAEILAAIPVVVIFEAAGVP